MPITRGTCDCTDVGRTARYFRSVAITVHFTSDDRSAALSQLIYSVLRLNDDVVTLCNDVHISRYPRPQTSDLVSFWFAAASCSFGPRLPSGCPCTRVRLSVWSFSRLVSARGMFPDGRTCHNVCFDSDADNLRRGQNVGYTLE